MQTYARVYILGLTITLNWRQNCSCKSKRPTMMSTNWKNSFRISCTITESWQWKMKERWIKSIKEKKYYKKLMSSTRVRLVLATILKLSMLSRFRGKDFTVTVKRSQWYQSMTKNMICTIRGLSIFLRLLGSLLAWRIRLISLFSANVGLITQNKSSTIKEKRLIRKEMNFLQSVSILTKTFLVKTKI